MIDDLVAKIETGSNFIEFYWLFIDFRFNFTSGTI